MHGTNEALLVIDQQLDFEPGGALAVEKGDQIVPQIAELMGEYQTVVMTQDSHPPGHISFASSHPGKRPYDLLQDQVLWPDHCIPGSRGWQLDPRLPVHKAHLILRKGTAPQVDSYSAFQENDGTTTGLAGYLRERGVDAVRVVGLAGDYCVFWSARDARKLGFEVSYDRKLTRFVDPKNEGKVTSELRSLGVKILYGT